MQTQDTSHVAIYARVSTEDQAERQTVKGQLDFLRKFCELHETSIAGEYVDDGLSGTVPLHERPEGRRLLDDAAAGRFGVVLVYRLDRLGRSLKALIGAYDALDRAGIAIRSGTEPFDTSTPIGRFVFQLLGSMAELERETIKDRMTMGRNRVAAGGKYTGGPIPLGYDLDAGGLLVESARLMPALDMTEGAFIRDLFQRIADGETTLTRECIRLATLGVPRTQRYGRRKGETEAAVMTRDGWSTTGLSAVIRNPVYRGVGLIRTTHGDLARPVATPLVVPAIWERAQEAVRRNRKLATKNAKNVYLLRGLIRCGNCGLGYTGSTSNGVRKYRCAAHTGRAANHPKGRCDGRVIDAGTVEASIWGEVREFIRNPGHYLADAQRQIRERLGAATGHEGERRKLLTDIATKETERERVLTMFRRGRISMDEADDQLEAVARETATFRELLESLRAQDALATAAEAHLTETAAALLKLRGDIDAIEAMADGEAKTVRMRETVELLVPQITVHSEVIAAAGAGRQRARKRATIQVNLAYAEPRAVEYATD